MWWVSVLAGCVVTSGGTSTTEPEPGSLSLTWSVGAGGCEAAGVAEVEVALGNARERLPCEDGGAVISGDPGRYDVVATGLDAGGNPRYEGSTTVTVDAGAESTAHVTLAALPASLSVSWWFENGRLCAANGVPEVHVVLFDDEDYVVAEESPACDDGLVALSDLASGTYGLLVEALDADGALAFSGSAAVELGKGDAASAEIELFAPAE